MFSKGNKPWNKGKRVGSYKVKRRFRGLNTVIRLSERYRQWRYIILQRDSFTCVICKKRTKLLEVDHIKPFASIVKEYKIRSLSSALLCTELWNTKNGRTLCKKCHKRTKTYKKRLKT